MGQSEINSLMKGINHPSLDLFKKNKYLGRGGFGHVWKVSFVKGDCFLAMKQLSKSELYKKNFISNIFEERDILNYLYNIHIVNLYTTFQDENYLYLIMDYLEGGDLRKHMKEKKFSIKHIKFIAACIIIGLEYIHRKGIIHRDIKPENLIFDEKGYLRISDFGIAIRNDKISEKDKFSDKSGTPGYMAPERIIVDKNINYNYSSDYFSLGVILYELIMLKKPFRKNNDKIGKIKYTSYDDIIHDLFNNEPINISPMSVRNYRNDNLDNDDLMNLCDLINKLLVYDDKKRLGYDNINNIKKHPFFGERFEWKKIYHRSYKSPFNTYDYLFKKRNEKNDNINENLSDINKEKEKINNLSDEEKIKIQKKFENFTIFHKITKEDFNYFYLKPNKCGSNANYGNDSNAVNKYSMNKKSIIKQSLNYLSNKNIHFMSQIKSDSNNNNKYKIKPTKLFKDNNKKENSNILKINLSPEKIKIPVGVGVIKENLINKYLSNTNNLHLYKLNSIKNNIINKMNDYLPLIHSSRTNSKKIAKPTSAIFHKKNTSSSIDKYKKCSIFYLNKNTFKNSGVDLLNKKEKIIINRNEDHYFTDSNKKLIHLAETSRIKKKDKYNLIKDKSEKRINEKLKEKIIELVNNNNNINQAIKDVIIQE